MTPNGQHQKIVQSVPGVASKFLTLPHLCENLNWFHESPPATYWQIDGEHWDEVEDNNVD